MNFPCWLIYGMNPLVRTAWRQVKYRHAWPWAMRKFWTTIATNDCYSSLGILSYSATVPNVVATVYVHWSLLCSLSPYEATYDQMVYYSADLKMRLHDVFFPKSKFLVSAGCYHLFGQVCQFPCIKHLKRCRHFWYSYCVAHFVPPN